MAAVRQLFDEAFGAQFREVVAQRSEGVAIGAGAESVEHTGVEFSSGEAVGGGDVAETDERMHERELARIVELEAGDALSSGGDRRLRQHA